MTSTSGKHTLLELLHDGFLVLLPLKNGHADEAAPTAIRELDRYLDDFSAAALRRGVARADIDAARLAFGATVNDLRLREKSGYHGSARQRESAMFFERLAALRAAGAVHLPSLEVFHMCLALGFQGAMSGSAQAHLRDRLGEDIDLLRNQRNRRPQTGRHEADVAPWRRVTALMVLCALGCAGLHGLARDAPHDDNGATEASTASSAALSSGFTK